MSTGFKDLSDEEKLAMAIEFVSHGTALPEQLREFLIENGLLELVTNPKEQHEKE